MGALSTLGLYFASRRWDDFVSTFLHFFTFEGAILYGICLLFVKTAHEFGHAYMAARYGVRVGTMGIAFLVMMPVPYTDVTGAWKLRSRRQRFMISAAGIDRGTDDCGRFGFRLGVRRRRSREDGRLLHGLR